MDLEVLDAGGKRYLHDEGVIVVSVAMRLFVRPAEGDDSGSVGRGRFSWRVVCWGVATGVGGRLKMGGKASLGTSVFAPSSELDLCGVRGMWWEEVFGISDVWTLGASSFEWLVSGDGESD